MSHCLVLLCGTNDETGRKIGGVLKTIGTLKGGTVGTGHELPKSDDNSSMEGMDENNSEAQEDHPTDFRY